MRIARRRFRLIQISEGVKVCSLRLSDLGRHSVPELLVRRARLRDPHQVDQIVLPELSCSRCKPCDPLAWPALDGPPAPHLMFARAKGDDPALKVRPAPRLYEAVGPVFDGFHYVAVSISTLERHAFLQGRQAQVESVDQPAHLREGLNLIALAFSTARDCAHLNASRFLLLGSRFRSYGRSVSP